MTQHSGTDNRKGTNYPPTQQIYGPSLANFHASVLKLGGCVAIGNLVRIRQHAISRHPVISPALARVAFANPRRPLSVLFSIIG
jgi:hypothetical protein